MYRTGDIARRRTDGIIEFVGRTDSQVKIGGNRIELGEIEAALQAHEMVKMAVVAVREDRPLEKKLVAYVSPCDSRGIRPEQLRLDLQEKVPSFMIPATFVIMDSFPLSPNGKVDRGMLPAPQVPAQLPTGTSARTEIQKVIAQIWESVLNISNVASDANFFDLGGDSLALIGVHARVQKALNVELSITDLFQHTTIASLAHHLDSQVAEMPSVSEAQSRGLRQQAAIRDQKNLRVRQGQ